MTRSERTKLRRRREEKERKKLGLDGLTDKLYCGSPYEKYTDLSRRAHGSFECASK